MNQHQGENDDQHDVPDLAASISDADTRGETPDPPLPRGWAGGRAKTPWRLPLVIGVGIMLVALLLIALME